MKRRNSIISFGGIAFIISGLLFLAQQLFLLPVPIPPSAEGELMMWLAEWKFHIAMADELIFFATLSLIPSIAALYRVLAGTDRIKAALGCGLMAVTIPVHLFMTIVLGRMVYPVYDLELTPDIYKLVLSMYYGGMHTAALILGTAILLLSFAIRRSQIGKGAAYVGFAAGLLQFAGAYPWLIGSAMSMVIQVVCTAWFILLGIRMLGGLKEAR
ncbi:hypothetical protein [Paenibacillus durus]|uniref:hypothetical protein n=1 Tax=Paenibacillus durus TaxID=44251 RepID=UPI0004AFDB1A|nr:hypothetical protein [Paenibacillus durus]